MVLIGNGGPTPVQPNRRILRVHKQLRHPSPGLNRRTQHDRLDPLHDLVQQQLDRHLHVVPRKRARLNVIDLVLVRQRLGPRLADDPLVVQVGLVAAQDNVRVVAVRVQPQLLHPVLHVQEALLVGDVEDQDEAHRVAVEGRRQAAEPFLAGRVPQLQVYPVVDAVRGVELEVIIMF